MNSEQGTCEMCGKPLEDHPDWVLPDRKVKYCNGVAPIGVIGTTQPAVVGFSYGADGEYL